MPRKCIYCGSEVNDESVIDFCKPCGVNVWGEKMFNTIVKNMEDARDSGDLCHTKAPIQEVTTNIIEESKPLEIIENNPIDENPTALGGFS